MTTSIISLRPKEVFDDSNNVLLEDTLCSESAFSNRFTKGMELMEKHPRHVPVMFAPSKDVILENDTLICPRDMSLCRITMQFRKNLINADTTPTTGYIFYIKLDDEKSIIPRAIEKIGELHEKYHGSDMWLTIKVDKEDIFG
jgi:hypothetical protein